MNPGMRVRVSIAGLSVPALLAIVGLLTGVGAGNRQIQAERSIPGAATPQFAADDWPWWRGPHWNGQANAERQPPLTWSETEHVVWKTALPGRGHGSPTIVGERVFLAIAEPEAETQSLMCLDRKTGKPLWTTVVHRGQLLTGGNKKSTHASATPACDGERVYITFANNGRIYCSALSLAGDLLWQQEIDDFVNHQGYGASPTIYGPLVLAAADHKGGGAIAGLDRITGKIVWKQDRPATANYTSPIILHADGRDQLVYTGCNKVASYDPLTGEPLWEMAGSTTECVTSTVTDGRVVFSTGGYPQNHVQAVVADGSAKVAWEKKVRVYVPSLLLRDGHLYLVTDDGVAACWRVEDGEELWKSRLGGTFTSSPVLVGDRIYATDESGRTTVFRASPDKFESLAENQLAHEVFATPVMTGGRSYHRAATVDGDQRQEWLYCLGE